jgi:thiamine-phosphate pyrophosphorylase
MRKKNRKNLDQQYMESLIMQKKQKSRFGIHKIYLILDMTTKWRLILSKIPFSEIAFVQLRSKEASDQQMFDWGKDLLEILPSDITLIVNDRVDVARRLGVGIHLGMEDMNPKKAREILGESVTIGLTIHDRLDLAEEYVSYINYVGVGPVFPTQTKKDTKAVLGIKKLTEIQIKSPVPVVAIGGINADNCQEVWNTEVGQIAVCSAIMKAENPKVATIALKRRIG